MNASEARKHILDVLVGVELMTAERRQRLLDEPAEDIRFAELGIDSMKIVDLCLGLEERAGREILVEELIENPTLNELADHLQREGDAAGAP
jgi:acyl carrier protein